VNNNPSIPLDYYLPQGVNAAQTPYPKNDGNSNSYVIRNLPPLSSNFLANKNSKS
jgi:hypothetical protein